MPEAQKRVAVIIEDDVDISNLLEAVLGQAGFETFAFDDGEKGVDAVRQYAPILTTLDVNLPGIDGFEVARRIRAFSATYIIMLTALDDEIDTLMGLDAGADDYLTKPFRHRELRARVEAMLRRSEQGQLITDSHDSGIDATEILTPPSPASPASGSPWSAQGAGGGDEPADALSPPQTRAEQRGRDNSSTAADEVAPPADDSAPDHWLEHNGLRLNEDMRLIELDGESISLTRSEFDLLLLIMERRRRVVSKDDLILSLRGDAATGGYVVEADRRAVEVHLANLRRKLSDSARNPRFIETVRGVGYRLAVPQTPS